MSETLALVILLVVIAVPPAVFGGILQGVAKRRGWSTRRLRHWMVLVSVGWPALVFLPLLRVIRLPLLMFLLVAAVMVGYAYLQFAGIHGWTQVFRRRRGEPGND